ncbi:MAG: hypothetical protein KDD35_08935 [Bdellovibrionales bacterium]|nr:hypothetical protein [Bdellovibrionales bacterium]
MKLLTNSLVLSLLLGTIGFSLIPLEAHAVKLNYKTIKRKAYFSPNESGELFTSLDLRNKRYRFTPTDSQICDNILVRQEDSLSYSCTLELPRRSSIAKLREQLSPSLHKVKFGKLEKEVTIKASEDARYVTFTTEFDSTGLDFETASFNDEFFKVYEKSAQSVIAEAMRSLPLRLQVLEN